MADRYMSGTRRFLGLFICLVLFVTACANRADETPPVGDALSEGFVGDQNLFDGGESFRRYVSLLDKAHVAVEGCMGELGFDFIPQPIITENELSLRTAYLDVDLSESQFADQWGFGITTSQLWDIPEVDPANFEDAFNPTAGLSDTDAVAYIEALNGTSESNPGCVQLQIDILSENGRALEARFEDVQQALELFADSTEIEAFYQDWAGCMMERGFTYTSPCLLYTSPSPRDRTRSRMPSSA